MKQGVLFPGRWQPFHNAHRYIVDSYVDNGIPVCIAIRNVAPDDRNPYTAAQVQRMIEAVYEGNPMVTTVLLPIDIFQVAVGRKVGFGIMQVPDKIKGISATKVRAGELLHDVPPEVLRVIDEIEAER